METLFRGLSRGGLTTANSLPTRYRCNDRYPVVAERDQLRAQVQSMLLVQSKMMEENNALQVCPNPAGEHCKTVESPIINKSSCPDTFLGEM